MQSDGHDVEVHGPRLPDESWTLTAPESYVLLYGLGDKTNTYALSWSRDERWLHAYLGGAGAAVFLAQLANPGHSVLKHIGAAVASNPSPDWSYSAAAWDSNGLDVAGLADSLDGAFSALDAGFLDGGGGDGGGGDGGGG